MTNDQSDVPADESPTGGTDRGASDAREDSTVETWMVRFFLVLIFGVAFGIEGRTLIRTFLSSGEDDAAAEATVPAESLRRVDTGDLLRPDLPLAIRSKRLTATAGGDWTFRLAVAPVSASNDSRSNDSRSNDSPSNDALSVDSLAYDSLSLSIERLTTNNDEPLPADARRTWAAGDTTALQVTWTLPPGQQPDRLRLTARRVAADTTVDVTDTVFLASTPVQMQR